MITFKQYLEEGRDAPLYHGTDIMSALGIIHNGFEPRTVHLSKKTLGLANDVDKFRGEKVARGVSLTRSLPFAKSMGTVVFEIDQRQLTQRYKVIPFQYFQGQRKGARGLKSNEYEEFVVTTKNVPFSLVKHIYVSREFVEKMNKHKDDFLTIKINLLLDTVRQKHGSSFIRYFD